MTFIQKFICDESGATAVEYGLIAALVAAALLGGAKILGESLSDSFAGTGEKLDLAQDSLPVVEAGGD